MARGGYLSGLAQGGYEFGAAFARGIYDMLTTKPDKTAKAFIFGLARRVDGALVAEDTPARIQIGRTLTTASNASAYDWGHGTAMAIGNIGVTLAPELAMGRAGAFVSKGAVGETATARATRLGMEGEEAVGLFGPKVGIRIPERTTCGS